MTKKASKLINERVIRRWGKLANMPSLTENFIDNLEEEDAMEDEMAAAEDEIAAGEEEVEGGMEAEASVEEQEAVENIVQAVVDAISAETGVEIEVEGGADDEAAMDDIDDSEDMGDDLERAGDEEMDDADAAAMRDMGAYNRKDLEERKKGSWKKGGKNNPSGKADDGSSKGDLKANDRDYNRKDETLNIDVVDDEALTEVVLKRVVERLLKKK